MRHIKKSLIKFVKYRRLRPAQRTFQDGRDLFFITGRCKSGNTWMAYTLGGHPHLFCDPNENQAFHRETKVRYFVDTPYLLNKRVQGYYSSRTRSLLKEGLITNLILKCDKPFARKLGDKSPEQDARFIFNMFPETKIIVMLRDFRDACVSVAFHWSRESGNWKGYFTGPDLKELDSKFVTALMSGYEKSKDFELYSELARKNPQQIMLVRYEDMKKDLKKSIKSVLDFLKTPSSNSVLSKCVEAGSFERHTMGRKAGQEDASSFFRKGIVGDWRNHFSKENIRIFKEIAGKTLIVAGYEKDNNW